MVFWKKDVTSKCYMECEFIPQMCHGIQSNEQVLALFVFCMDNAGHFNWACGTSISTSWVDSLTYSIE